MKADSQPVQEEPEEENELQRALQRRRKVVDKKGKNFEKAPVANSAVDVKWDDNHETQFTPRSHQKNAGEEEVAPVQADGQATGGDSESPVVDPPTVSSSTTAPVPAPVPVAGDAEVSRADAAKAALLQPSDIAEKLPPMDPLPARKVSSRLVSSGLIVESSKSSAQQSAPSDAGDQGKTTGTSVTPVVQAPAPAPKVVTEAPAPAPKPVEKTPEPPAAARATTEVPTPAPTPVVPSPSAAIKAPPQNRLSEAPMPNALKTPTPAAGVARMVSTPLQQNQNGGGADPMMWRAVVEGDVRRLEDFAARGLLSSGRLTDQNGHSIFWNAVAFQKAEVALWLLRRFPPDSTDRNAAIDLSEVHARRGDSLLHLCMYFNDFSASAADLFRHVFAGGSSSSSQAPRDLVNQNGQTFLSIAAARLNFWALRFVLTQAPSCVQIFRKPGAHMPLEVFLRRVRETSGPFVTPGPVPPAPTEAQLPSWCQFGRQAPRSGAANPAFADLVVEVEDPKAEGGIARIAAHRVIVGSCSGKLHEQIRKLPEGEALRLDALCCRSEEVLIALMTFLYTGEIRLGFREDAFLLWQLLCLCVQYSLPQVLTAYVRTALVSALRQPRFAAVVPVLLQAADKVGLTKTEAAFIAGMLAGSPQALDSIEGEARQAQALLAAVVAVEKHVQGSSTSAAAARAPTAAPAPVASYAPAPTPLPSYRELR